MTAALPDTFLARVGKRLETAREALGKSRAEMAKAAGVSYEQWCRYERNESLPSFDALAILAFHDIDVAHILTDGQRSNPIAPLSRDEKELVTAYRACTLNGKKAVKNVALELQGKLL